MTGTVGRVTVIDVETTGFSPRRGDRIIEIAVVLVSPDGGLQEEFDTLVNPHRDVGPIHVHGITATDLATAPSFDDIAGSLLRILRGACVIAGHNIGFDLRFIASEYGRIGIDLPPIAALCTYRYFGRQLDACCRDYRIPCDGPSHRALADARATGHLVGRLLSEAPQTVIDHQLGEIIWPELEVREIRCCPREQAEQAARSTPSYLDRLLHATRHNHAGSPENVVAYYGLLDRILEDRCVDANEADELVASALDWGLSRSQIQGAHEQYLRALAAAALADQVVTESERRDLESVARLLGLAGSTVDTALLSVAQAPSAPGQPSDATSHRAGTLVGQRVCFTGQLRCTQDGIPITREAAETLAREAGLDVAPSVTKRLDILVIADPNSQSGKARKARKYGIRILAEDVFWSKIGVAVD
ncbi:MAG: DNA polymerase III [Planctomycetes bacterium]|nr:DNA polymerase III [Planctomycetota bacterium]